MSRDIYFERNPDDLERLYLLTKYPGLDSFLDGCHVGRFSHGEHLMPIGDVPRKDIHPSTIEMIKLGILILR